jgi:hypothetical protein
MQLVWSAWSMRNPRNFSRNPMHIPKWHTPWFMNVLLTTATARTHRCVTNKVTHTWAYITMVFFLKLRQELCFIMLGRDRIYISRWVVAKWTHTWQKPKRFLSSLTCTGARTDHSRQQSAAQSSLGTIKRMRARPFGMCMLCLYTHVLQGSIDLRYVWTLTRVGLGWKCLLATWAVAW